MRTRLIAAGLAGLLVLGACTENKKEAGRKTEERTTEQLQVDMQKAHPIPKVARSQIRQNLVDIITAQAESTITTSFFFLEGVGLVSECPSIGFPIASTAQLTNPDQLAPDGRVLPQMEPTGIYTGSSSGTYVICVDAKGDAYARYFEGYVMAVSGPAEFVDGQVRLTGPSSFDFDEGEG